MRFDAAAPRYDSHAAVQRQVASWCAQWLPPAASQRGRRGTRVLELGAGTGMMTRHLAALPEVEILATDLSAAMIAVGRRALPSIRWEVMDAWHPSDDVVAPSSFDLLATTSLLQWAEDPVGVLRRWRTLVRPGGRLLATCFISGSLLELSQAAPELIALSWRDEATWLEFLREAGFHVERSSTWSTTQHFATAAQALRSVHQTGAVRADRLSPTVLRRGLRAYAEKATDGDGRVPLSWKALRVEAHG